MRIPKYLFGMRADVYKACKERVRRFRKTGDLSAFFESEEAECDPARVVFINGFNLCKISKGDFVLTACVLHAFLKNDGMIPEEEVPVIFESFARTVWGLVAIVGNVMDCYSVFVDRRNWKNLTDINKIALMLMARYWDDVSKIQYIHPSKEIVRPWWGEIVWLAGPLRFYGMDYCECEKRGLLEMMKEKGIDHEEELQKLGWKW